MTGPWEDYASPGANDGPWNDYASKPSIAGDVAKQIGSGLVEGTANIPTALPRMLSAAGNFVTPYLDKLGVTDPQAEAQRQQLQELVSGQSNSLPGLQKQLHEALPAPKTTTGEYARTAGEFVPAAIAAPGRVAGNIATGIIGGLGSEAGGQLTKGTDIEPYARFAGALVAPAASSAARHFVTPLPASAERMAAVQNLQNAGVTDLTAGQITGSRPLQWFEQALGDIPGSGRRASRATEQQAEQFTGATLRQAGENATRATPEVVDRAFNRIGGEFDRLSATHNVDINVPVWNRLQTVAQEYQAITPPAMRAPIVENVIRNIGDAAVNNSGRLTGDVYQHLRSQLDRAARGVRANPELSNALFDVRNALDDAMEQSILRSGRPQDIQAWREARRQYRNMLVVEKAATGAGENAALGLISPSKLREATVAQNRRAYARGNGDFAELARSGEAVMRPLPQSGTAPRSYAQHLPTAIGATIGGIAGGVPGAAIGGAAAIAGPPVLGRMLMSAPVQAYLRNQVFAGPAKTRRAVALSGLLALHNEQARGLLPFQ